MLFSEVVHSVELLKCSSIAGESQVLHEGASGRHPDTFYDTGKFGDAVLRLLQVQPNNEEYPESNSTGPLIWSAGRAEGVQQANLLVTRRRSERKRCPPSSFVDGALCGVVPPLPWY